MSVDMPAGCDYPSEKVTMLEPAVLDAEIDERIVNQLSALDALHPICPKLKIKQNTRRSLGELGHLNLKIPKSACLDDICYTCIHS